MNLGKLGLNDRILAIVGVVAFVNLFLPWFTVSAKSVSVVPGYDVGGGSYSGNAWNSVVGFEGWFPMLLLIGIWIHHRSSLLGREQRKHLLKETAEGFRVVFGIPVLRAIATVALIIPLLVAPAQGLSPAWAGESDRVKKIRLTYTCRSAG